MSVQIVKGWLDATGSLKENVYDIAWAGDRVPGTDGKLQPVGNTVQGALHQRYRRGAARAPAEKVVRQRAVRGAARCENEGVFR